MYFLSAIANDTIDKRARESFSLRLLRRQMTRRRKRRRVFTPSSVHGGSFGYPTYCRRRWWYESPPSFFFFFSFSLSSFLLWHAHVTYNYKGLSFTPYLKRCKGSPLFFLFSFFHFDRKYCCAEEEEDRRWGDGRKTTIRERGGGGGWEMSRDRFILVGGPCCQPEKCTLHYFSKLSSSSLCARARASERVSLTLMNKVIHLEMCAIPFRPRREGRCGIGKFLWRCNLRCNVSLNGF